MFGLPLKWILPILLVIGLGFFINRAVDNMQKAAYEQGYAKKSDEVKKKTEKQNKLNREFEQTLGTSTVKYGERKDEKARERIKTEVVYKDRIETIIVEKPIYNECKVDQEVTDARNEIRRLGPEIQK